LTGVIAAAPREILVPEALAHGCVDIARFGPVRMIEARGKREPLAVCSLEAFASS